MGRKVKYNTNIVLCCVWANLARSQTPALEWKAFLATELNIYHNP